MPQPNRKIKTPKPSIGEFLRLNPLPPNLANLEPAIRQLPSVEIMFDTLVMGYQNGLTGAQLERVFINLAEFYKSESHRCVACLGWSSEYSVSGFVDDPDRPLFAICAKCCRLIESGRDTQSMRRNVECYVIEVSR